MGRVWNKIYCEMKCWSNTIWNNRLICRNLYNNLEEYTWSVPRSSTAHIQVGSKFGFIYSVSFRPLALIKHSEHRDSSAGVFVSTLPVLWQTFKSWQCTNLLDLVRWVWWDRLAWFVLCFFNPNFTRPVNIFGLNIQSVMNNLDVFWRLRANFWWHPRGNRSILLYVWLL